MGHKFKLQSTSFNSELIGQTDNSSPSNLAFVNVSNPTQAKDKATQRRIRRHVMRDIGGSRRRDTVCSSYKSRQNRDISRPLTRYIPPYWGDFKVCTNFKRLFWAMDMVSEGLLSITVIDAGSDFRTKLDNGLQKQSCSSPERTHYEMKQYTESLSLVRKSITSVDSPASRYAVIGTIICLAVFDVSIASYLFPY